MTREEAKVILKGFMENPLFSDIPKVCRAFDMAIKALEQQPSEDTEVIKVSEGTVKARQGRYVTYDVEWLKKHFYTTEEKIYGQPKSRWIPVSERLPDTDDKVLCWYEYYHWSKEKILPEYGMGCYYKETETWLGEVANGRDARVIAWQPLPKPYEPTN